MSSVATFVQGVAMWTLRFKHGGTSISLRIAGLPRNSKRYWKSVEDLVRKKINEDPRFRLKIPASAEI